MMPSANKPLAVAIMGPTASGKTAAALEIAREIPAEIISVDSALVYRGMDIGTAKPDAATCARAPHHLVDILDPTESYSAARFRADALRLLHDILARGRIPLLVGGTMLYFKALKEGLAELPVAAPALRAELEARAKAAGWPALHAELARLDPETATRLAPNDAQRIQRALEVCLSGGESLSALLARQVAAVDLPCQLQEIALMHDDRAWLHERIDTRFKIMLEAGLVDELRGLRERYPLNPELPAMRCVGYRQAWRYLEGEISGAELFASGAAATRQLAKRQITWLRGWAGAMSLDCRAPDLLDRVSGLVERDTRRLGGER